MIAHCEVNLQISDTTKATVVLLKHLTQSLGFPLVF